MLGSWRGTSEQKGSGSSTLARSFRQAAGAPRSRRRIRSLLLQPDGRPGVEEGARHVVGRRVDIVEAAGEAERRIDTEQIVDANREAEAVVQVPAQLEIRVEGRVHVVAV